MNDRPLAGPDALPGGLDMLQAVAALWLATLATTSAAFVGVVTVQWIARLCGRRAAASAAALTSPAAGDDRRPGHASTPEGAPSLPAPWRPVAHLPLQASRSEQGSPA
jgi:hypothetical protein